MSNMNCSKAISYLKSKYKCEIETSIDDQQHNMKGYSVSILNYDVSDFGGYATHPIICVDDVSNLQGKSVSGNNLESYDLAILSLSIHFDKKEDYQAFIDIINSQTIKVTKNGPFTYYANKNYVYSLSGDYYDLFLGVRLGLNH